MHDRQGKTAKRIGQQMLIVCFLVLFTGCASLSTKSSDDSDTGIRTITGIDVETISDTEQVVIHSTGELEFSSVKKRDPSGIIFYFPDTRLETSEDELHSPGNMLSAIRTVSPAGSENVRMEMDLSGDFDYEVEKTDAGLRVIVKNAGAKKAGAVAAETGAFDETTPESSRKAGVSTGRDERGAYAGNTGSAPETTAPKSTAGKTGTIRQIDFSSEEDGKSAVIVGTDRPVEYEVKRIADRRLQLRLFDAELPEHRKHRPLITTRFDSAVDRITPIETPGLENTVDFIIELRERVPYRADAKDGRVTLHFDRSTVAPRPFADAGLPPWQEVLEASVERFVPDEMADAAIRVNGEPVTAGEPEIRSLYESYFGEPEYTGEKVALDFHETNIKNVFRILQPISGKNYAVDPDVEGTVSLAMERPVPWDQVLDLILTMNRLGMVEHGDIIRIARLQTLREEEEIRRQRVRDLQEKQEDRKALEPLVTEYIPISYANASAEILPHVRDVISEDRGKVSVDARNNQLIITDVRDNIRKARRIISEIDKVTPQVVIEARIVEVSTDFSREIGTSWSASGDNIYRNALGGDIGYNVSMNHPAATATSGVSFDFTRLAGTEFILNAQLNAMEEEQEGKIISSPKIVTMDNKSALITQGFEYPYRVRGEAGADPTVEFKDIDLRLEVTPQVTPDDRISLKIHITKDDIDQILPTGEPSLRTNEARTELIVDDGETLVIGGIRREAESITEEGFPLLRHIPLLGWLFKSESSSHERRELLIFMTPKIVQLEQRELVTTAN